MDFQSFLHSERLFLDAPYDQQGMHPKRKVEPRTSDVVFDNYYRAKGEKIYCHICGSHKHFKGITGLYNDGARILFGSKCAKDFFGPEVFSRSVGELRLRTKKAHDRFIIAGLANSVEPVQIWMNHYRKLLSNIEISWADIRLKYQRPIDDIFSNIQKNSGRLVEISVVTLGGSAAKSESFHEHRILASFQNSESIRNLTTISQRGILVDRFVDAVHSVKHEPSEQLFSNLANLYNKSMLAAEEIDACLRFTADFFRPEKLQAVSDWCERRRRERLVDQAQITPQNLGPKFQKIMGYGVEMPRESLTSALRSTELLTSLEERKPIKRTQGIAR